MTPRQAVIAAMKADPEMAERLAALCNPQPPTIIRCPEDLAEVVRPLLFGLAVEHFVAVALDRRNRVIGTTTLTTGSDGFCIVDPRQVLRWALLQGRSGATSVAVAHNHPSGDPTPSDQDRIVTARLRRACEVVGINLIDHLTFTDANGWRRIP